MSSLMDPDNEALSTWREVCPACRYPRKVCICADIEPVSTTVSVSVMQDPSEVKHAKNTARLIPLLMRSVQLTTGILPSDFKPIRERVQRSQRSLVLFPQSRAKPVQDFANLAVRVDHLILLDGTWRKAKKLWLNNPWLHALDCAIVTTGKTEYVMRKAPFNGTLSTLEAAGIALGVIDGTPMLPFNRALAALQQRWFAFAPEPHNTP
ncbi:tRNA-uridine aminocarboxypropyltransferase [Alteromonas oceanisediminis]|uniref:tRNA-uridine aminocarboxypropyltransferase n=1 Tax=Alteromonas oceanisediminis TaxID=2836180 RepID=UPI001BD9CB00|nr:tRNA-uridine aminocarboxypropyltransferase [Alteromonas oceanisediminis]MBT0586962.1 DTW domain-containing protein [Alteromonas oceanisediminis]